MGINTENLTNGNIKNDTNVINLQEIQKDIDKFSQLAAIATIIKQNLKDADDIITKNNKENNKILTKNIRVKGINYNTIITSYQTFLDFKDVTPHTKFSIPGKRLFASKTDEMKNSDLKKLAKKLKDYSEACNKRVESAKLLLNAYKKSEELNSIYEKKSAEARALEEKWNKAKEEAAKTLTATKNTYQTTGEHMKEALNGLPTSDEFLGALKGAKETDQSQNTTSNQ